MKLEPSNIDGLVGEVMVVAGEASGDHHGADLVRALRIQAPGLKFSGMGGVALAEAGQDQILDNSALAVMGLAEVAGTLGRARAALRLLTAEMKRRRPLALILVDFPDFNIRLARVARQLGLKVIYFISPQIWAWRSGRVHTLARDVDLMVCILPFEPAFYRGHGLAASFVGHPLVDQVPVTLESAPAARARFGLPPGGRVLALLPGSRRQEVKILLPAMLAAARRLKEDPGLAGILLPQASTLSREDLVLAAGQAGLEGVQVVEDAFHQVLRAADLALVASGTATLATAMVGTPMILGYRLNPLTYVPLRYLTQVSHAGLVNLVAGRRLVPELLQDDFSAENLVRESRSLFKNEEALLAQTAGFAEVRSSLGKPGVFGRAATIVARAIAGESTS
jgi:lipid-A-disaccharide synthase